MANKRMTKEEAYQRFLDIKASEEKRAKGRMKMLRLSEIIQESAKINIVTCGMCGTVILHKLGLTEIECYDCGFQSEPSDFPDLYY